MSLPQFEFALTGFYFCHGGVTTLCDITVSVVTGSSEVEQERKQEVITAKPQVVLRQMPPFVG